MAASGDLTAAAGGNINLTAAYVSYTQTSSKTTTQIGLTLSAYLRCRFWSRFGQSLIQASLAG